MVEERCTQALQDLIMAMMRLNRFTYNQSSALLFDSDDNQSGISPTTKNRFHWLCLIGYRPTMTIIVLFSADWEVPPTPNPSFCSCWIIASQKRLRYIEKCVCDSYNRAGNKG